MRTSSRWKKHNSRGQALVEFALVVPFFAVFLAGTVFLCRFFGAKLFLMQVAKQGYLMMAYTDSSEEETRSALHRIFDRRLPRGLQDLSVNIEKRTWWRWQPSRIEVQGRLAISGLSKKILGRDGIIVRAELSGYTGTWSRRVPSNFGGLIP